MCAGVSPCLGHGLGNHGLVESISDAPTKGVSRLLVEVVDSSWDIIRPCFDVEKEVVIDRIAEFLTARLISEPVTYLDLTNLQSHANFMLDVCALYGDIGRELSSDMWS